LARPQATTTYVTKVSSTDRVATFMQRLASSTQQAAQRGDIDVDELVDGLRAADSKAAVEALATAGASSPAVLKQLLVSGGRLRLIGVQQPPGQGGGGEQGPDAHAFCGGGWKQQAALPSRRVEAAGSPAARSPLAEPACLARLQGHVLSGNISSMAPSHLVKVICYVARARTHHRAAARGDTSTDLAAQLQQNDAEASKMIQQVGAPAAAPPSRPSLHALAAAEAADRARQRRRAAARSWPNPAPPLPTHPPRPRPSVQAIPQLYNQLGELQPIELVNLLHALSAVGAYQPELYAAASEFAYTHLRILPPR
jgi:hypothetical protein